jgi:hypothetical protein
MPQRRFILHRAALAGTVLALLAAGTADAGGLKWSAPVRIDAQRPLGSGNAINAVSCPSGTLCVAVDSGGDLLTSTDPAGGAQAWRAVRHLDPTLASGSQNPGDTSGITGISCPTTHLCVATDGPDIIVSTDPTGGAAAWHVESSVDHSASLAGVACASATLCVAFDRVGDILTSTSPAEPAGAWTLARLLNLQIVGVGIDYVASMTCPSASLCVASDIWGQRVLSSSDPIGGATAWTVARIAAPTADPAGVHTSIACASATACLLVGVDGAGVSFEATSPDPVGGAGAWKVTRNPFAGQVDAVACSRTICLADTAQPSVLQATSEPGAGMPAWHQVDETTSLQQTWGVACAPASLCLTFAVQDIATSTNPGAAHPAWQTAAIDTFDQLDAIGCRAPSTCVAVDGSGDVVASADPAAARHAWRSANVDGTNQLLTVSCAAAGICVAGDESGNVVASADPTARRPAWKVTPGDPPSRTEPGGLPVFDLACPLASLCVGALDNLQNDADLQGSSLITATDPLGGDGAWHQTDLQVSPTAPVLSALACPSATLCVAFDSTGNVETSIDPAGGKHAWTRHAITGVDPIALGSASLSCPSTTLCVGVDGSGDVITSTAPAAGLWTVAALGATDAFLDVACPSTRLCVAVDSNHVYTTSNPTGGIGAWQQSAPVDGDLDGVACASTRLCVAIDSEGYALIGRAAG